MNKPQLIGRVLPVCLAICWLSFGIGWADDPQGPRTARTQDAGGGESGDDGFVGLVGRAIHSGLAKNDELQNGLKQPPAPPTKPEPTEKPRVSVPPEPGPAAPAPPPAPPKLPPNVAVQAQPLVSQSNQDFKRAQAALEKYQSAGDQKTKEFYRAEVQNALASALGWQQKANDTIYPVTANERRAQRQASGEQAAVVPHGMSGKPALGKAWEQAKGVAAGLNVDVERIAGSRAQGPEGFDDVTPDKKKRLAASPVDTRLPPGGHRGTEFFQGGPRPPSGSGVSFAAEVKQPGGVKLRVVDADRAACALRFKSISYDPVRGTLLLAGDVHDELLDLGIVLDCLQLAREQHDPFFSLDAVSIADWDRISEEFVALVSHRFPGRELLRKRIQELCPRPQEFRGPAGPCRIYYAPLDVIDPESWETLERKLDTRVRLVFSPEWLRYSEVGWILYEADLAIKGIVAGYLEDAVLVHPVSRLWELPGFVPEWIDPQTKASHAGLAGRANLELADCQFTVDGATADLSQLHPRLVIAHRRPGETADLPAEHRCEVCERIKEHLRDHWSEYAERIPALDRLDAVFRAYVAARYLVQQHPGLIARLQALPRRQPENYPPLYHLHSGLVRLIEMQGDAAATDGTPRFRFDIGGGYGGGVTLESAGVRPAPGAIQVSHWVAASFPASYAGASYQSSGEEAAVLLRFAPAGLTAAGQALIWLGMLAIAFAVAGGLTRSKAAAAPREDVCADCLRTHRVSATIGWCCDVISAGTLLFLLALPFIAAGYEARPVASELVTAVTMVAATLVLTAGCAFLGQSLLRRILHSAGGSAGLVRRVGAGARWIGGALAVGLLLRGVSEQGVGEQVARLGGAEIGERLLVLLAGADVIRAAAVTLLAAAGVACLARWLLPRVRGSRPLVWSLPVEADHVEADQVEADHLEADHVGTGPYERVCAR